MKCPENKNHEIFINKLNLDLFTGLPKKEVMRIKRAQRCEKHPMSYCKDCQKYYLFLDQIYIFNPHKESWQIFNLEPEVVLFT